MESPLIVQAEYPFKGGNNDELCFKKGDLITVTQREEGGWWEGTLNDKTGWFPSNYVIEYKVPLTKTDTMRPPEEIQEYRSVVLKDLLDSERAHVAEIEGLLENFLQPLLETEILTQDEYVQLMCNFVDVVNTHNELLSQMEECNDRIGKLFLTKAPLMKHVHQAYCAAHPKAIVVLDKHKDELEKYMERQGAATPGLLVLTTGLSKPFRRLDKYSAMLQELERHMESSHPDRGDTQRSVAVYKDIAATCSATRRQKELELQVLTGPVRGWQGQELSSLGDIIHMGSVAVGFDHRDRYFVLFPQTLLILSVSQRMSAFIYEGKLPLTGIVVNRLEDSDTFKNAFEISGNFIEKIVAVCQGPNEANKWVELLTSANPTIPIGIKRQLSNLSNSSVSGAAPQPPPHISPPTNITLLNQRTNQSTPLTTTTSVAMSHQSQHKRSLSFNHHLSYNQYTHTQLPQLLHHQQQQPNPPNHPVPLNRKSNLVQTSNNFSKTQNPSTVVTTAAPTITTANARTGNTKANWSITTLRPAPPLRPSIYNSNASNNVSGGSGNGSGSGSGGSTGLSSYCSGRKNQPTFEEDALVLRVFEAYCAAYQNNARNTVHSALERWTPCLPIRGGKLKTSKLFSTSNPQLQFLCRSGVGGTTGSRQSSTSSLNSSCIWREVSPNNFNLYSTSVSSLNANGYRNSTVGAGSATGVLNRAFSEERATRKSLNRLKSGFSSGYDNIFTTPKMQQKNMSPPRFTNNAVHQAHLQMTPKRNCSMEHTFNNPTKKDGYSTPGLYDRRLNRSFETTDYRYANYGGIGGGGAGSAGGGGSYMIGLGFQPTSLRRSTPHLIDHNDCAREELLNSDDADGDCENDFGRCGVNPFGNSISSDRNARDIDDFRNGRNSHHKVDGDSQNHSGSWCCGNFVMKQWRKTNNY
ncbi:rho guanine nucleotide exchange factor 7 isoform X2 [Teleopsis dalmanni]|uniref:rho guanine nucleotide exchange factor 7 isoform X2 n=1 Tax=Teleopsis dalmanni TaxID=139649 RepID=UPI0018CCAB3F|nr:rho guanine nucleotide exchange factor 7 isoform X2 [Teleopsis dalmanni]